MKGLSIKNPKPQAEKRSVPSKGTVPPAGSIPTSKGGGGRNVGSGYKKGS